MIEVLFALAAMGCASLIFLAGATWAAWPRLRATEPARRSESGVLNLASSTPAGVERDAMTLAR